MAGPPAAEGRWTGQTGGGDMTPAVTAPAVRARKGSGEPLVMVTAYDAPGARIADAAGVDLILVGDSLAMVVLGYDDTLSVTVADMEHHTAAVARARPRPMVVTDLPWLSYHLERRGRGPQRRPADPGRRPGGEAGGRAQTRARDRGHPRRRDPRHGPHRPDPAVAAHDGRLQGPGEGARRRRRPGRRRPGAGRGRVLRHRPRRGARTRSRP